MRQTKSKYRYLNKWIVGYRGVIINVLVSSILVTFLGMNWPLIYRYIINKVFYDGSINELGFILILYLLLFFSEKSLQYIWKLSEAVMSSDFLNKIRKKIYEKIYKLELQKKEMYSIGEIIDILNNDVQQIYTFLIDEGVFAITCFVRLVMAITYIYLINNLAAAFIFILVIINYFLSKYLNKRFVKYYNAYKENLEGFNKFLLDVTSGLKEIKIFNAINFFRNKYATKLSQLCGLQNSQIQEETNREVSNDFLNTLAEIVLYIAAAYAIISDKMLLGDFVSLMIYYEWAKIFFGAFTQLFTGASKSNISIKRINDLMDASEECMEGEDVEFGKIELKNISFGYSVEKTIIKNLSMTIDKGSTIAIVGPSGTGKSTIINMLMKFYLPDEGDITYNNKSIKDINCKSLRSLIGIVSQNAQLFEGTIRYNLLIGNENATDAEIWNALKIAGAHEFVDKLPKKLEANIDKSDNLSTGQIQRIILARIILKNPQIVILDEATSNIDLETEKRFLDDASQIFREKTIIIIAYRVNSLQIADEVYFLRNGIIEDKGTHKELFARCKGYKELICLDGEDACGTF